MLRRNRGGGSGKEGGDAFSPLALWPRMGRSSDGEKEKGTGV